MQTISQNQDYSSYYQGAIPQYSVGGNIDYSQLSSVFSRTPETMQLVYQYAPQISQDVSYIFDFSNQGAYGVYIPALVEEIKTNELKNRLTQAGYEIKDEGGMLVAYPKDGDKDDKTVQEEIKQLWDQINAGKSEVLGVNINKVKSATQQNMQSIVNESQANGVTITNPNLLWDMLIMLELGATIVHEWEHSRGGDESASESMERDFVNKMIDTIKQKYQSESGEDLPLELGVAAKSNNWYKYAQYVNYLPSHTRNEPNGSDLSGRHGGAQYIGGTMAGWSMLLQQNQSEPIEKRLGRGFMSPLAKGLNPEKDIIEKQLRKQFANDYVPNVELIYEELLSKDWDTTAGYKTLEQLLEEKRPQPLMVPLEKTASSISSQQPIKEGNLKAEEISEEDIEVLRHMANQVMPEGKYRIWWNGKSFIQEEISRFLWYYDNRPKLRGQMALEYLNVPQGGSGTIDVTASKLKKEATLFGWYNNLEISDGSTIPGLGDRVMAWDDRDESFAAEEDWIKSQPRYNPTYDIKGFYYRWIEPRFKPQLWDDMTQDLSNTHPAKRFAQVQTGSESEIPHILRVLETIKDRILAAKMKASRLIITSDLYPMVKSVVECDGINLKTFSFGETDSGELIYAVWITDSSIPTDTLRQAEFRFQSDKASEDLDELIEDLLGFSNYRSQVVDEIVSVAKSLAIDLGIKDVFVVGMYARERAFGVETPDVEQLDISTYSRRSNAQLGELLASRLGVQYTVSNDLVFIYKGIKVEFSLTTDKRELTQLSLFKKNLHNQMVVDLLRRDFTINMLAYNIIEGVVIDPLRVAKKSIRENIIRTYYNPKQIVKNNPFIILRALKLKLKYGMDIDRDLEYSMITNSNALFTGSYSDFELLFARESIRAEGNKEADGIFDEYGLWKLKKLK